MQKLKLGPNGGELIDVSGFPEVEEYKPRVKIYGTVDTRLEIDHIDVPNDPVELFVDGWVHGKRNEGFGNLRYHKIKPTSPAWDYGYKLARERVLYFSQALHSFLLSKHAGMG